MSRNRVHFVRGEHYPQIEVIEEGNIRFLRFGAQGGWQGALHTQRPDIPVFPYQRAFHSLVNAMPEREKFLSVGVGTGTALRTVHQAFPRCELYGVEIEQSVVDIATHYFDSPSHEVANYWIGDGVAFLCNVDLTFDFIFVDAYLSNRIYSPCLDPSFPKVLSAALTDDGVAVSNVIAKFPLRGAAEDFVEAAKEYFSSIMVLPVGNPLFEQNMLVVFAKQEKVLEGWLANIRQSKALRLVERVSWPMRLHSLSPVL